MRWLGCGMRVGLIGVLLLGCGGADAPPTAAVPTADRLQPLTALGPCDDLDLATDAAAAEVEGLILPEEAVITSVEVQAPLTTVQGWVPATPLQVQAGYVERPGLEVITLEDEVWESETLVADGQHRLFVKAQAVCEDGSVFLVVVAPDDEADALPVPAGG